MSDKSPTGPTWSFFDNPDTTRWILVKKPNGNLAREIVRGFKGFDPDFMYSDTEAEGDFWAELKSEWEEDWKELGLPDEFDLKEIANCDNVDILDAEGNDIKQTYLGEKKMGSTDSVFGAIKGSFAEIGSSALGGVKLAAAGKANEAAYDRLKPLMQKAGIPADTINDPKFQEAIMMLLPMVLHPLASTFEGQIPYSSTVKDLCEVSITEGFRKNSGQVMVMATELFKAMHLSLTSPLSFSVDEKTTVKTRIAIDYKDLTVPGLKKQVEQREIDYEGKASRENLTEALEANDLKQSRVAV